MICALPAPPSRSRPHWHSVEHLPCVLWARPERTFCTRAHYADPPHCLTRHDPTLAPTASLNRTLARSLLHGISGALQRRWQRPWRHAGVGSSLRHVRHRPNHASAPAAPRNRSCLSSCLSECVRRRQDALHLQQRLSPAILSSATAGTCLERYIKGPRAHPSTHATSGTPRRASRVMNRAVVAVSLNSGQLGRR